MAQTCDFRVVHRPVDGDDWYEMAYAFSNADTGKIEGMEGEAPAGGRSLAELRTVLTDMLAALDKPVVEYADYEYDE